MTNHIDTTVHIGTLTLKNPVMAASGTFGYGEEFADFVDLNALGGFIVKGTTLEPRQGNPYPRMAETPSGMLNAVGLQNPGVDHFIRKTWPRLASLSSVVAVNVSGASVEDYAEVCRRLAANTDVRMVEINISCPNVRAGGMAFGTTCAGAGAVTRAVRSAWPHTLVVKLSPNVTDVTEIAKTVEGEGADAVSLINTLMGMAVDVRRRRAVLSTVTGGLSGPAVKPVALRMVWQTAKAVGIPVIGLGGIMTSEDALEFIMAGATAVQVGTANFINPSATGDIVRGIEDWCIANGVRSLAEIRGII